MKVAIIGAGIVGATAAYYLSKEADVEVTIFDEGVGQATKAAAGIICPWFARKRNKNWYKMARLGADFYQTLVADLQADGHDTSFYEQVGAVVIKSRQDFLEETLELALTRREESPLMGEVKLMSQKELDDRFEGISGFDNYLWASGAARLNGAGLVDTLLAASEVTVVPKKVGFERGTDGRYIIEGQIFDQIILACGAWLPFVLEEHGYKVAVRPQKGQIIDYQFDNFDTGPYPVIMPHGEGDIIPFRDGNLSVGASHEDKMGYDLTLDEEILAGLEAKALPFFRKITDADRKAYRVGIRAYTPNFAPFFGQVPEMAGIYAASGLGSSGLTTGPLIGRELVHLVMGTTGQLNPADHPIEPMVVRDAN
ncbi:glycine/D-amino acid oxidase-like deaminating enzyme [Streptococcus rupicaprae]|uniref:Glycine/D-amino acid oxidase-like deaminating enzyme n=1 Tax=Streptococcus rupicaprae TaxID=759619 RepID=A0ABV2FJJ7_9STRE